MPQDRIALLAATRVFGGLDRTELGVLAERAVERRYRRHQFVFRQGDPGDWLFVVATGLVKLELDSRSGDELVLATLAPPQTFGELAVLDGGPRSASAEAVEDTWLLGIARPVLLGMITSRPKIADALLRSIGADLRRLTERTADTAFLDLPGRVAKLLLTLASTRGARNAPGEIVVDLQLNQTDLAHMVGGSRQSVNRILAGFQERGLLENRGRTIVVKRPDLLQKRAET